MDDSEIKSYILFRNNFIVLYFYLTMNRQIPRKVNPTFFLVKADSELRGLRESKRIVLILTFKIRIA
jgi:hypothetical protein